MTKKEARRIAIKFIDSCGNMIHEMLHKHTIDDSGTQSESGYEGEDYEKVEKEVEFLLSKIREYELKK